METQEIKYDSYGRMMYNPEFHANDGKKWTKEDVNYLIDWYEIIGPEELSFALERTIKSVQQKVSELRKKKMLGPATYNMHNRINGGKI
jgi:hypothetical protein